MLGAIIGTGFNVAANAIGSWLANKRKREAEQQYAQEVNAIKQDLDRDINSNYLDRADARNAIRKTVDAQTEAMRQLNTDAIRGGATDEAKVAMASKLNQATADVVGNLSAAGEQHKDRLRDQKRQIEAAQAQHNYALASDMSGWDTLLQNVGQASQSLGTAWSLKGTEPFVGTTTGTSPMPDLEDTNLAILRRNTGF